MPIFKLSKKTAHQIPVMSLGFGDEASLRDFFASNLEELLGVRFLEKEYPTLDGRIDTLGLDENNSPVIIEYKWKENEEVLSQGLFYSNWLLNNKKHFELLAKSRLGDNQLISWDQPRVILVARGFSRYILAAVRQVKYVELKTYALYGPDILQIENVYTPDAIKPSSRREIPSSKNDYDLAYHLGLVKSDELRNLALTLRDMILELPGVEERVEQKTGITYRTTKSFTRFEFRPTMIRVIVRGPRYKDPQRLLKDISHFEWGYKGMIKMTAGVAPKDVFEIVKQSYESTL